MRRFAVVLLMLAPIGCDRPAPGPEAPEAAASPIGASEGSRPKPAAESARREGPTITATCQRRLEWQLADAAGEEETEAIPQERLERELEECAEMLAEVAELSWPSYLLRAECYQRRSREHVFECDELFDRKDPPIVLRDAEEVPGELASYIESYFQQEHVMDGLATHLCPHDSRATGSAGPVPSADVSCGGADEWCTPVAGRAPREPWEYPLSVWAEAPWDDIVHRHFESPHPFRIEYSWANATGGYGDCGWSLTLSVDHDGDGEPALLILAGHLDQSGKTREPLRRQGDLD